MMGDQLEVAIQKLCNLIGGLQSVIDDDRNKHLVARPDYFSLVRQNLGNMEAAEREVTELLDPVRRQLFHESGLVSHGDAEQTSYCEIALSISHSIQVVMFSWLHIVESSRDDAWEFCKNSVWESLSRVDAITLSKLAVHEIRSKVTRGKAETQTFPRGEIPSDPQTHQLCIALRDGLKAGREKEDINRDFQTKNKITASVMESLKRSSRNYRHLWDPTASAEK